ncbi:MAG: hypothetical protein OEV91_01150 [Desulfobulbaceae bacterium]|nr:hypothetical protein [Desulfobulbaceae bacterium]
MASQNTPPRLRQAAASLFLLALFLLPAAGMAKAAQHNSRYDVLYIWDNDLNNLQDYKEELENQLGSEVGKKLRIVQRGNRYGIIYDRDGTALSSAKIAIRHSAILNKAGLGNARAIKDEGYHELFNVTATARTLPPSSNSIRQFTATLAPRLAKISILRRAKTANLP